MSSREGQDRLWLWFGLSRASFAVLPRVMMHDMPDEWQDKMAALLEEWDETWDTSDVPNTSVSAKRGNKFTRFPEWVLNYRRPDRRELADHRAIAQSEGEQSKSEELEEGERFLADGDMPGGFN